MKRLLLFMLVIIITMGMLSAATITVTKPASGETVVKGSPYTIQWTKSGSQDASVKIRLYNTAGTIKILDITNSTANNGSFSWPVPNSVANGNYVVRVKTLDNVTWDDSGVFTISDVPSPAATITVTKPVLSETVAKGGSYNIQWTKSGPQDASVKIRLYNPAGTTKILDISNSTTNDGSFSWNVPNSVANGSYTIRVKTIDNLVGDDSSIFSIAASLPSSITVQHSQVLRSSRGATISGRWRAVGITGNVRVNLRKADGSGGITIIESIRYNASGFDWQIPSDFESGNYFIRVEQGEISGRSRDFEIKTTDVSPQQGASTVTDLEIVEIFADNGRLHARVRSNNSNFRGNIEFMAVSPVKRVTKWLNLSKGVIKDVSLIGLSLFLEGRVNKTISCMIDSNLRIPESDESNNTKTISVSWKNLTITCFSVRVTKIGRKYKFSGSYGVDSSASLRNVKVKLEIKSVDGDVFCEKEHDSIIPLITGGQTYHLNIKLTIKKQGGILFDTRSFSCIFKKGKRYRMIVTVDPDNTIEEINERDNSCSKRFTINR